MGVSVCRRALAGVTARVVLPGLGLKMPGCGLGLRFVSLLLLPLHLCHVATCLYRATVQFVRNCIVCTQHAVTNYSVVVESTCAYAVNTTTPSLTLVDLDPMYIYQVTIASYNSVNYSVPFANMTLGALTSPGLNSTWRV